MYSQYGEEIRALCGVQEFGISECRVRDYVRNLTLKETVA